MGPAPGNPRLNELLDQVRAEFETQARASGEYEHSSKFLSKNRARARLILPWNGADHTPQSDSSYRRCRWSAKRSIKWNRPTWP